MSNTYIAVHGGAGLHGRNSDPKVKQALQSACNRALKSLVEGASALYAVDSAISTLEDDPCLNAGRGLNLTLSGVVECDAGIMDGLSGDFGSVGAVSGVKNPIRLAHAILEHARIPDRLGRIPPLSLVSDGAHAFAVNHPEKVQIVTPESLVTPKAREQWMKWKDQLPLSPNLNVPPESAHPQSDTNNMQDTVGALAWDNLGGMAAGVSSGGLLLKYPGRIGEASVFGAGCWAQQSTEVSPSEHAAAAVGRGMACSVSGAGEYIVRAALARSIGDAFDISGPEDLNIDVHEILRNVLVDRFWKPCRARGEPNPNAGVLLLVKEDDGEGRPIARLWCAFTTPSMAIAYASSRDPTPKVP